MIKKLRSRFALITMGIFCFVLVATLTAIFVLMSQSEKHQSEKIIDDALNKAEMSVFDNSSPNPFDKPPKDFPPHYMNDNPPPAKPDGIIPIRPFEENDMLRNAIIITLNKQKQVTDISYRIDNVNDDEDVAETAVALLESNKNNGIVTIDNVQFRYKYRESHSNYFVVLVDRSIEISTLRRLIITFLITFVILMALLSLLSIFLARWTVKPIEKAWEKQKQFVADASHELKTPLTVIGTNADVIMSNPDDLVKNQLKWLEYIKTETVRMTKLVSDLLYIAKTDANQTAMNMIEFNISDTVSEICLVFEALMFEKHKNFDYSDIQENIIYKGDKDRIKQLFTILLDNAMKHSPNNADIKVSLTAEKKKIQLIVTNTGETIPKENLDKIFERFYRVDKSRARETGGCGLGLSIAKTIVDNHKGNITVTSKDGEGTSFTVTL